MQFIHAHRNSGQLNCEGDRQINLARGLERTVCFCLFFFFVVPKIEFACGYALERQNAM